MSTHLQSEIDNYFLQPINYGVLEEANAIGFGKEASSSSYVIMYLNMDNTHILDLKFASNAIQDVNSLGSIFTEMVKGDTIANALETTSGLEKDLLDSYANVPDPKIDLSKAEGEQVEHVSTQYQDCANMVLTSFRAALRHRERKVAGIEEEYFEMNIAKSCPYSGTDCHFMQKESAD